MNTGVSTGSATGRGQEQLRAVIRYRMWKIFKAKET
jgi:hypothetical protein